MSQKIDWYLAGKFLKEFQMIIKPQSIFIFLFARSVTYVG